MDLVISSIYDTGISVSRTCSLNLKYAQDTLPMDWLNDLWNRPFQSHFSFNICIIIEHRVRILKYFLCPCDFRTFDFDQTSSSIVTNTSVIIRLFMTSENLTMWASSTSITSLSPGSTKKFITVLGVASQSYCKCANTSKIELDIHWDTIFQI